MRLGGVAALYVGDIALGACRRERRVERLSHHDPCELAWDEAGVQHHATRSLARQRQQRLVRKEVVALALLLVLCDELVQREALRGIPV